MSTETIERHRIRCYDLPAATDRYTAVYLDMPEPGGLYAARSMSDDPFHPLGIGQFTQAADGHHLGTPIRFDDLPPACKRLIRADLTY